MDQKTVKLIVALLCIVVAAAVLAWHFGVFGGSGGGSTAGTGERPLSGSPTSEQGAPVEGVSQDDGGTYMTPNSAAFDKPPRRER